MSDGQLNVFFDVDQTIISDTGILRPHVREVFALLGSKGHRVFLWSGVGRRTEVVRRHDLGEWIVECFAKPTFDYEQRWRAAGVGIWPDFCVDDHPEVIEAFGGVVITPFHGQSDDAEILRVYECIVGGDA